MNRLWRTLSLLLVFAIIGLIFSGQLRLLSLANGFSMTWSSIISWELTRWCLWAFLFPAILALSHRYPIYPSSRSEFIWKHLAASALLSLIHLLLFSLLYWFVIRAQEVVAMNRPLLESIFQLFPEQIRKKNFDPENLFQMIFIIDFHIGILVYWIILAGHQAMAYARRAADLKTQLAEARLDALKMQLHPHFLFNTLNSISALLHKDPETADEMIGELGNFLRLTLHKNSGQEISLEEELEFLKSYLEIERIRFQNRLTIEFAIDPETLHALVPNLILQPIIENAVRHGIAQQPDAGRIEVRSQRNDGHLRLDVLDDGPGLRETAGEGIGLKNVRERLQNLYGSEYEFRLSNNPNGSGSHVEIVIPFYTERSFKRSANV